MTQEHLCDRALGGNIDVPESDAAEQADDCSWDPEDVETEKTTHFSWILDFAQTIFNGAVENCLHIEIPSS